MRLQKRRRAGAWTATVGILAASLAASGATYAQEQPPPTAETTPPATAPTSPAPAQQPDAHTTTQTWSAKRLIDTDVFNAQGQEVGEIEDVLVDNDGKVAGVVMSVGGGFLGLGDREVAISFQDLTIKRDSDGRPAVTTSLSQQALETAPEAPKR